MSPLSTELRTESALVGFMLRRTMEGDQDAMVDIGANLGCSPTPSTCLAMMIHAVLPKQRWTIAQGEWCG